MFYISISNREAVLNRAHHSYLIGLQQVTVLAHPKRTSMLHKFLLHPPHQEQQRWASLLQPHQLRTWARPPQGSLSFLTASMVRKRFMHKEASCTFIYLFLFKSFPQILHIFLNVPGSTTTTLSSLHKQEPALWYHLAWTCIYTSIHASCVHEPLWLCCEDSAEVLPFTGLLSDHFCPVVPAGLCIDF